MYCTLLVDISWGGFMDECLPLAGQARLQSLVWRLAKGSCTHTGPHGPGAPPSFGKLLQPCSSGPSGFFWRCTCRSSSSGRWGEEFLSLAVQSIAYGQLELLTCRKFRKNSHGLMEQLEEGFGRANILRLWDLAAPLPPFPSLFPSLHVLVVLFHGAACGGGCYNTAALGGCTGCCQSGTTSVPGTFSCLIWLFSCWPSQVFLFLVPPTSSRSPSSSANSSSPTLLFFLGGPWKKSRWRWAQQGSWQKTWTGWQPQPLPLFLANSKEPPTTPPTPNTTAGIGRRALLTRGGGDSQVLLLLLFLLGPPDPSLQRGLIWKKGFGHLGFLLNNRAFGHLWFMWPKIMLWAPWIHVGKQNFGHFRFASNKAWDTLDSLGSKTLSIFESLGK